MREGLDIEAQRGANLHDIFAIQFLENGGFPRVIKPAKANELSGPPLETDLFSQKKYPHLLLFLSVLSYNGQQAHGDSKATMRPEATRLRDPGR